MEEKSRETLINLIKEYGESLSADSPTHRTYFYTLSSVEAFFNAEDITTLEHNLLTRFAKWLKVRGYASDSIRQRITVFRNLVKYGELNEIVPLGSLQKLQTHYELTMSDRQVFKRRQINSDDIEELVNFVPDEPEARLTSLRTTALIHLLAGSGVRISEAIGLNKYEFQEFFGNWNGDDDFLITIVGKGAKIRTVPLLAEFLPVINVYLEAREDNYSPLFISHGNKRGVDKRILRQTAWRSIKQRASLLGIESFIGPHAFRHYYLERLANAGVDLRTLSDIAGHADVRVTHKSYLGKVEARKMSKAIRKALGDNEGNS